MLCRSYKDIKEHEAELLNISTRKAEILGVCCISAPAVHMSLGIELSVQSLFSMLSILI